MEWGTDNSTALGAVDDNIFGVGNTGLPVKLTFDHLGTDQVLSWDGTRMTFSEPLQMTDDKALRFRDANNTILSHNTDFDLGMVSDGVIKLDSEGDIQIESDDNVIIKFDANSSNTATAKLSIQNTPLSPAVIA